MVKKSIIISFLIVSGATVLSRVSGFFREASLAAVYGASGEMDAFMVALSIPDILFSVVGAGIATVVVPVYGKYLTRGGCKEGCRVMNNLLNTYFLITVLVTGICFLSAPFWVSLIAPGFSPERSALAVKLLKTMSPSIVLMVLVHLFTGILQAHHDFAAAALAGLPFNMAIIAGVIVFGSSYGIGAAAVGVVAGFAGQVLILVPSLCRTGYHYEPVIDWRDSELRKIAALLLPVIMGTTMIDLNILVQRVLGSGLPQGSIAALNYAQKLVSLPNGILVVSLVQVIYPVLSGLAVLVEPQSGKRPAAGEYEQFRTVAARGSTGITFMLSPLITGMIALSFPLTRLAYQRGAFSEHATYLTATGLIFYAAGLWGLSQRQLLNSAFYALEDTRTPMALTAAAVVINIVMSFSLVGRLGLGGLALADSLTNTILAFVSFGLLNRRLCGIQGTALSFAIVRMFLAAVLAGILMGWVYSIATVFPETSGIIFQALRIGVSCIAGFTLYLVLCVLLGIREVRMLKEMFKRGRDSFIKKSIN